MRENAYREKVKREKLIMKNKRKIIKAKYVRLLFSIFFYVILLTIAI